MQFSNPYESIIAETSDLTDDEFLDVISAFGVETSSNAIFAPDGNGIGVEIPVSIARDFKSLNTALELIRDDEAPHWEMINESDLVGDVLSSSVSSRRKIFRKSIGRITIKKWIDWKSRKIKRKYKYLYLEAATEDVFRSKTFHQAFTYIYCLTFAVGVAAVVAAITGGALPVVVVALAAAFAIWCVKEMEAFFQRMRDFMDEADKITVGTKEGS